MSDAFPSVSLIVPVFNRRVFLRPAVESLLREGIDSLEILVVDDGSTDGALEEVEDLPVTCLRPTGNHGVSFARNIGLQAAHGEWIAFLDSDDILAAGGLRWRLEWAAKNPGEGAVGGVVAGNIDALGRALPRLHSPYCPPEYLTLDYLQPGRRVVMHCGLYLYRRELLRRVGFFDEKLAVGEDQDFNLRVLKCSAIRMFQRPVFFYRVHSDSLTAGHDQRKLAATIALVHFSHGTLPLL